ncbi:MAG: 1-acyl-sn-glycerol-3-phosphate acyltransferase [Chloroflexi bacterium]|nr:MAG: 1-acyl-sn-glycerol-3-phosphate acyltransferase [Chloroflexota bacterium]
MIRALIRAVFGESAKLRRAGLAGMPNPSRVWYVASAGVVARFFFRTWTRWELVGRENVPESGGVILVSNHLASADPPMLAAALYPRWPKFMAKVELFQKPLVGHLFALSGAFPVRRFEADLGALREAERLLARGEILGMFPEGHRSDTGALIEAHPGTAMIALRSGAAVVPVAITGSQELRRGWRVFVQRPRVRVIFGEAFRLEREGKVDREAVDAGHLRIMREIAVRLPATYRGVYRERFADLPDAAGMDVARSDHVGAS